jgi:hypothetical protein
VTKAKKVSIVMAIFILMLMELNAILGTYDDVGLGALCDQWHAPMRFDTNLFHLFAILVGCRQICTYDVGIWPRIFWLGAAIIREC